MADDQLASALSGIRAEAHTDIYVRPHDCPAALAHLHARSTVPSPAGMLPSDAETAALASLRATLAAGNPWTQNQLQERFSLTRAQATKIRQQVLANGNGHHEGIGT